MSDPTELSTDDERPDPSAPLTASGNLRRRMAVDVLTQGSATAAALLALGVLVLMVYTVVNQGASAISWDFVTQAPPVGIAPEIVGTLEMAAFATVMAMPAGILIALYLTEYSSTGGRLASLLRLVVDLIMGIPSIVIAIVVFGLLVAGSGQSGFAASCALAIIMVPLIARSSQEVLLLVPSGMLDAADALGVARWRKVVGVLLPSAMGGILTGTVLALARAAGETAPMLILSSLAPPGQFHLNLFSGAVPNIPYMIFNFSEQGGAQNNADAWGAALVLLTVILIANLGSRWWFARSQRKMGLRT